MAAGWSAEETKALIDIWGEAEIQNALDGVVRNKTVYQKVASAMNALNYNKTWQNAEPRLKTLFRDTKSEDYSRNKL